MPFSVTCPYCHTRLKAKDDPVGKKVKCPACGRALVIPIQSSDARTSAIKGDECGTHGIQHGVSSVTTSSSTEFVAGISPQDDVPQEPCWQVRMGPKGEVHTFKRIQEIRDLLVAGQLTGESAARKIAVRSRNKADQTDPSASGLPSAGPWKPIKEGLARHEFPIQVLYKPSKACGDRGALIGFLSVWPLAMMAAIVVHWYTDGLVGVLGLIGAAVAWSFAFVSFERTTWLGWLLIAVGGAVFLATSPSAREGDMGVIGAAFGAFLYIFVLPLVAGGVVGAGLGYGIGRLVGSRIDALPPAPSESRADQ